MGDEDFKKMELEQ